MTDFLSIIHAVVMRNVNIGLAPLAISDGTLDDDPTLARLGDEIPHNVAGEHCANFDSVHNLTFRYYDTTSAAVEFQ